MYPYATIGTEMLYIDNLYIELAHSILLRTTVILSYELCSGYARVNFKKQFVRSLNFGTVLAFGTAVVRLRKTR